MYYELGSHPTPVRDTGFKCVYIYTHIRNQIWFSLRLLVDYSKYYEVKYEIYLYIYMYRYRFLTDQREVIYIFIFSCSKYENFIMCCKTYRTFRIYRMNIQASLASNGLSNMCTDSIFRTQNCNPLLVYTIDYICRMPREMCMPNGMVLFYRITLSIFR